MTHLKDAWDFASNHPIETIAECIVAFGIIWGGAFLVALAG